MATIDQILRDPERYGMALRALIEIATGDANGPHRAAYLEETRRAEEAAMASQTWNTGQGGAQRIDGLEVMPGARELNRTRWCVAVPVRWGDPRRYADLDAETELEARDEVDARFPLAPWWPALARVAKP